MFGFRFEISDFRLEFRLFVGRRSMGYQRGFCLGINRIYFQFAGYEIQGCRVQVGGRQYFVELYFFFFYGGVQRLQFAFQEQVFEVYFLLYFQDGRSEFSVEFISFLLYLWDGLRGEASSFFSFLFLGQNISFLQRDYFFLVFIRRRAGLCYLYCLYFDFL